MHYFSHLLLALAALMHAGIITAAPSGDVRQATCPGPPSVLRAREPESCIGQPCGVDSLCCTCHFCVSGSCE
ncbi:hypothetical protein C8R44DRAFT_798317 [Mycena epipterygia]|nr:hypothetical protein C8R44DRAFT_798317 [Mycena epipterygia]